MIKWPTHCKKCEYYVSQMCDYCNQTGKSRLKEFGVDESLELDDRITDLNNRCTHWQDERNQKEYYAQKRYEELTAKRAEKKRREEEKRRIAEEKKLREEERRLQEMNMYKRRYTLWRKGLSDAEIGRREGCDKSAIWKWRERHNIPYNKGKPVPYQVPADIKAKRLELYKQGFSDEEIAEKCGLNVSTVKKWRWRNHYQNENRQIGTCDRNKLLELHKQGLSDVDIAKELKCKDRTVQRARIELGLEPNMRKRPVPYRDKFLELYNKGMTDRQIADELGKTRDAIRKVRGKMGLPRND